MLVNNAGIMDRMPFLEMTEDFWHHQLDINLGGTFFCAQAAARSMVARGRGGRIVNMASNSGLFGGRGRAAYGASKAGIINLTQTMAIELAEHDILVNAVAPGPIETELVMNLSEDWRKAKAAGLPLGRFGKPEDVAATVAFLASEDAKIYVGQTLGPNSGDVML